MQTTFLRNIFICLIAVSGLFYLYQFNYFHSCLKSPLQAKSCWLILTNAPNHTDKHNEATAIEDLHEPNLALYKGRFDKSREYRIYDWVWTGKSWGTLMQKFDVCLATQMSIEKVNWLLESVAKWKGPISAAVYLINYKELSILKKFVTFARKCSPDFAKYVSIHVAFPANMVFSKAMNYTVPAEKLGGFDCTQIKTYFNYLMRINVVRKSERMIKSIYPQNFMRNIARKTCGTDWVFTADVDLMVPEDSASNLQAFYETPEAKKCKNCAYVIPAFELALDVEFPKTKMELVNYVEQNKSRQLHKKYHQTGHKATDYAQWMTTRLEQEPIRISHPVNTSEAYYYEPFYIAPDSIPPFDERFIGYGYTRNSQIDESMIMGWNFSVLTPIFGIHWGMKDLPGGLNGTLERPDKSMGSRDRQDASNYIKYMEMMKELELQLGRQNQSAFGFDLRLPDKRSILVNLLMNLRYKLRLNAMKAKKAKKLK